MFKAAMHDTGWPDWMPPSRADIAVFVAAPEKLRRENVAFSVARLAPWRDRAEFDAVLPGEAGDAPFYTALPVAIADGFGCGPIGLRRRKIGTKWPPGHIQLEESADRSGGAAWLTIRYQTPWAPLQPLAPLLDAVLRAQRQGPACLGRGNRHARL